MNELFVYIWRVKKNGNIWSYSTSNLWIEKESLNPNRPPKGPTDWWHYLNKENNMSFINRREGKDRRNPEKFNIDR